MGDELKIVIKAVLDDNAEKDLNSQLKSLNLEPISPKLKLDLDTSKSKKSAEKAIKDIDEIISKKVIKNPISLGIFKEFGIKNRLDREEISKAVESYQNAIKIGNKDEIVKSYEDLFATIKGSFFNFTKSLEDHEQEFLNRFSKQKMYISPQIKSDLRKDNYKYYRQNLVGKLTTDPQKALSPDVLYSEIYNEFGGVIPHPDKIINDSDRFQIIADKIIELREKAKATYDEEDILWNIGSDNEIKKRINDILSASTTVKETAKIVRPIIKNIKSDLVDMSDPHWRSIIEHAPFDINEKPKRSIKVPFQIDLNNPDEVQMEMERIVAEFTKNKGKLVDYKISTISGFDEKTNDKVERLSTAVIKYKNELGETITKQLQWQKVGQEIDQNGENKAIMGFAENYAIYSQNIEKATEKQEKLRISTEKLENKLTEYKKSFDNLQIKADKSGVKLNADNISSFEKAINNKNLEQARHLLSMLSKEWQGLNAAMVKDTPNTALENMNRYITKMPYAIEALEIKLKTLSNPSKELQDKVQNLKTGLENVYKSSSNDEKLANYGKLKQAITNVNAELTNQIKLQRELNQNANLVYDKQTFSNRIQVWANQNAEAAKVFRNEIEKVKEQIENADKFKLTNLKKQFQEITTNAKAMGITSETIFEKIFGMFGKLSSMIFGGSFLIFAVNSLKEIYNNILSIDSALVNVKKVTDETDQTYQKLISDSSTWAVKLGTSIDKMMNTTADFVRHGYSLKDAFDLSKTTAIFKNVSYTDIGTASTNIISTMKAFKLEAKDSMQIIDKLNDVGNKFSISSAGLSEGLRVSAASLATANNTLDESLGLITAANEVIQDPREAGNAVKVLSLRLRNTKGKLEEIGESTEGMVESVTRLQTQLLNLTNGKVNIMASPDTFKSTYQVMKEIANVWDDLTDVKRANIIELIAGKHRANVITSIVKSMETAEDVVNVSINSQGSAMREQEKSVNSIHAKMEQIKASVQSLSTSLMDSGFVKFIL
ncbi:phage tail tape measure protein, partial [bacterium]|nr:phage tail tape measure protein [bacterium]